MAAAKVRQSAVEPLHPVSEVLPWERPVPAQLYKYFPPERLHVLRDCLVRFTQRQVFEDQFELLPPVKKYGTADEIRRFMQADEKLRQYPEPLREAIVGHVLATPEREKAQIELTRKFMTAPDEFAAFCLSEDPNCDRMWNEYAEQNRGFVLAFDTKHPKFASLRNPGLLGKVEYSDDPIPSFLSAYGPATFFRKRNEYSFEAEWRSIRALKRFTDVSETDGEMPVYLAPFEPDCLKEILIQKNCSVEWELRFLAAIDARYRHVAVRFVNESARKG